MSSTWLLVLTTSVLLSLNRSQENGPENGDIRRMLRKCKKTASSPDTIAKCLINGLHDARDAFEFGDIDVKLPIMDPQAMDKILFNEGTTGQVNINAVFNNVVMHGISEFRITELKIDYVSKNVIVRFDLPEVLLSGLYKLSGSVLVVPITGEGTGWIKADDVKVVLRADMELSGKTLHFNITTFDFEYGKAVMRLNNLFHSDPVLGATLNSFVNDNVKDIFDDMKPEFIIQLRLIFEQILNQVCTTLTFEDIPGIENMM